MESPCRAGGRSGRPARTATAMAATIAAALLGCAGLPAARAAEASRSSFGTLADGRTIEAVTLSNRSHLQVRIITLGAIVQSLQVPDARGRSADVVLGFDTAREYVDHGGFFGATVGRFANRIANARFSLDGRTYMLDANDHGNSLHGGKAGFDKVVWTVESVASGAAATAVLSYVSPDGEGGYPGTLRVSARFSLDEANTLHIEYQATTDKPTLVNISNHSYFNLGGAGGTAMDQVLTLNASRYTPVDEKLIPTGELADVGGTAFDFRHPTAVGARVRNIRDPQLRYGRGYDHNFVLDGAPGSMRLAATLVDPTSGRRMQLYTDAPGLQFYSGNFLDATISGKGGLAFRQGDALVFEPQLFPDAPNQPGFPTARLEPGSTYRNRLEYRFTPQAALAGSGR
jgi:aldose 1-epimerase